MPAQEILSKCKDHMHKAQEYFYEELKGVRTGRASPALIEHLKIDVTAYGSSMDLRELATVSTPEPALLIVKPYDPATSKDIERAILASNLGLTPNVDGSTIRLPIPMLSGERRQQLTQEIKRMAEAQKVTVRNARRDANKHVDTLEKEHQLSKDQAADAKDEIQKLTKQFESKIDEQSEAKQKEVTAV